MHTNDRTSAARPQDIKRLGRGRGNANRFKRVLNPLATRNLHDGLIKIIGLGIDCVGRSKTRGHVEFRVDNVYRDDFGCASNSATLNDIESNPTTPDHGNGGAAGDFSGV